MCLSVEHLKLSRMPKMSYRLAIGLAAIVLAFAICCGVLLALGLKSHHHDKTDRPGAMRPVYTTRAFKIDGQIYREVAVEELSSPRSRDRLKLYVYPTLPPLSVHSELTTYFKYEFIFPWRVWCSGGPFYLNAGSVMNITFCARDKTRLLVIKGDGYISDYDHIKYPFKVVFDHVFQPAVCQLQSKPNSFSRAFNDSDVYHFCFEANTTGNITDILFAARFTQYNVSATGGQSCMPPKTSEQCSLPVPDRKTAIAIVELYETDTISDLIDFTLHSSVRSGFSQIGQLRYVWGAALGVIGLMIVIAVTAVCFRRCNRKPGYDSV